MKLNKKLTDQARQTSRVISEEVNKKVLGIHKVLSHTKALLTTLGVDKEWMEKHMPKDEELDKISTSKKFEKFVMRDLIKPIAQDIERNLGAIKKAVQPEMSGRTEAVVTKKKYTNVNSLEVLIDKMRDSVEDRVNKFLSENKVGREVSKLIEAMKEQIVSIIESLQKSISDFIKNLEKNVSKTKSHEQVMIEEKAQIQQITLN